ncbi:MAG: hypothetical protein V4547_16495 [Bacteroidota bacterium]
MKKFILTLTDGKEIPLYGKDKEAATNEANLFFGTANVADIREELTVNVTYTNKTITPSHSTDGSAIIGVSISREPFSNDRIMATVRIENKTEVLTYENLLNLQECINSSILSFELNNQ